MGKADDHRRLPGGMGGLLRDEVVGLRGKGVGVCQSRQEGQRGADAQAVAAGLGCVAVHHDFSLFSYIRSLRWPEYTQGV